MDDLKLVIDYKNNTGFRHSFNELAGSSFGIDFEAWYNSGCWDDTYICHSYIHNNSIVSNVSVSLLNLIINNKNYKAVLIGTVMTRPEYRNRGLSKSLMNSVLGIYEKECDLFYLFANKSALGFYPKFGFEPVIEHQFSIEVDNHNSDVHTIRKLDLSDSNDLNLLKDFAAGRLPVSRAFGVLNGQAVLLWHCLYAYKDEIYYITEEDLIIIYKIKDNILNIYDIIAKKEYRLLNILKRITAGGVKEACFHFTPDDKDLKYTIKEYKPDDALFVKSNLKLMPGIFKYPVTAQA